MPTSTATAATRANAATRQPANSTAANTPDVPPTRAPFIGPPVPIQHIHILPPSVGELRTTVRTRIQPRSVILVTSSATSSATAVPDHGTCGAFARLTNTTPNAIKLKVEREDGKVRLTFTPPEPASD